LNIHHHHMQNNFTLFSELQKQLSPSPIKTWRLLKQLRDDGHMKEPDDFLMQDRKLYVNVPRFIVELESLGYSNVKSNDFKSGDMKSDEIMELVNEMKLISSEITESRIQEEMKSDDFTAHNSKPNFFEQDAPVKSEQQNVKSSEINSSNLKSHDFTDVSREIIAAKNEVIDTLKGSIQSKEDDVAQLRAVISDLTQQLKTTSQQNAWLTNLLVAPKPEHESTRSTRATDINDEINDFTDEITVEDAATTETDTQQGTAGETVKQEEPAENFVSDEQAQPAI
jgi:hypothetical protein